MDEPAELTTDPREADIVSQPIAVVYDDPPASASLSHDVVDSPGRLVSRWSNHLPSMHVVNKADKWPEGTCVRQADPPGSAWLEPGTTPGASRHRDAKCLA